MGGAASAWAIPLVLGLAAAGAAYGLDQLPKPTPPLEPAPFEGPSSGGSGLRFGVGGVETVQATLYVFNADGKLLASNAPPNETARFAKDGDFQELPELSLYLGNGTPPPGAVRLPPQLAPLRLRLHDNLTGHAVGDVVEVALAEHPWLDVFGPLRVVARVDGLAAGHAATPSGVP